MLQDTGTPQGLAYQWIVFNDPMQLNPCWPTGGATIDDTISQILLQRYSVVVLYYSTHGNTWIISNNNWLSNQSICEWDYITCDNTTNNDETSSIVQQIVLGTYVKQKKYDFLILVIIVMNTKQKGRKMKIDSCVDTNIPLSLFALDSHPLPFVLVYMHMVFPIPYCHNRK
jgi:hypothetical protein